MLIVTLVSTFLPVVDIIVEVVEFLHVKEIYYLHDTDALVPNVLQMYHSPQVRPQVFINLNEF